MKNELATDLLERIEKHTETIAKSFGRRVPATRYLSRVSSASAGVAAPTAAAMARSGRTYAARSSSVSHGAIAHPRSLPKVVGPSSPSAPLPAASGTPASRPLGAKKPLSPSENLKAAKSPASAEAVSVVRQKRLFADQNKGIAKAIKSSISRAGKGLLEGARGMLAPSRGGVADAAGLAAGGPVWGAFRELVDAIDVSKNNKVSKKIIDYLSASKKSDARSAKKGGAVRGADGRFLSRMNSKNRAKDRQVAKVAEKKTERRHKELIRAIEGRPAGGGFGGALASVLGPKMFAKFGSSFGLKAIGGFLGRKIGSLGGLAVKGVKALGATAIGAAGLKHGKSLFAVAKKIPGVGPVADVAGKVGGKALGKLAGKAGLETAGKMLLKKLPVLGLLAGVGFAAKRLMDGDILGATGEVLSGVASLLPGLGTAASLAIDGALAVRDAQMPQEPEKVVGDGHAPGASRSPLAPLPPPPGPDPNHPRRADAYSGPEYDPRYEGDEAVAAIRARNKKKSATVFQPPTASPVRPVRQKPSPLTQETPQRLAPEAKSVSTPLSDRSNGGAAEKSERRREVIIPTEFDDPLLTLMAYDRI